MSFPTADQKRALSVELAKLYAVEQMRLNEGCEAKTFACFYLEAKQQISEVIDRASSPL